MQSNSYLHQQHVCSIKAHHRKEGIVQNYPEFSVKID